MYVYAFICLIFFTATLHAQGWLAIGSFLVKEKTGYTFHSSPDYFAEKKNVSNCETHKIVQVIKIDPQRS